MDRISVISLIRIALRGGPTIRLCDGGFITWNGETFNSIDPIFGTIGSIESMAEGVGDEIPALELTLLPPVSSAPSILTSPDYQNSEVRIYVGEFNQDTGQFYGNPDFMFIGQVDQPIFRVGRDRRELSLTIVSTAERLFMRNNGNSLTPRWQKSIWPGDKGHDNAVGLTIPVAWGVASRPIAHSGSNGNIQMGTPFDRLRELY